MTVKAPMKKSEDDLAKWVTERKTQEKTVVSKTVPPESDKAATALGPVQPDKVVTTMQSMMLRKRKAVQDKSEMTEKAITSNDMDEETELNEDLED